MSMSFGRAKFVCKPHRLRSRSIPCSEKIATRYSLPRITNVAIPWRSRLFQSFGEAACKPFPSPSAGDKKVTAIEMHGGDGSAERRALILMSRVLSGARLSSPHPISTIYLPGLNFISTDHLIGVEYRYRFSLCSTSERAARRPANIRNGAALAFVCRKQIDRHTNKPERDGCLTKMDADPFARRQLLRSLFLFPVRLGSSFSSFFRACKLFASTLARSPLFRLVFTA